MTAPKRPGARFGGKRKGGADKRLREFAAKVTVPPTSMLATAYVPYPPLLCRHCGDSFYGPERDCPSPDSGRAPYKDSDRGGHRFDPPAQLQREPMSRDRMQEIRGLAALTDVPPRTLASALADLLAEYDAMETKRKRLQRCVLETSTVGGDPVFTREQIDRIMDDRPAGKVQP